MLLKISAEFLNFNGERKIMTVNLSKFVFAATAAVFTLGSTASVEAADKRYTLGSLGAGTTPFLVNTAWAKAVNKYVPGHKIQVSGWARRPNIRF